MILFNITSTTPHVLSDKAASVDLKRAYRAAMHDRSTILATQSAVDALSQLVSKLAFSSFLNHAVLAAAVSGQSVANEIRTLEKEISEHSEVAHAEIRTYEAYCAARRDEAKPALSVCAIEQSSLCTEEIALMGLINGFSNARRVNLERYEAAGLSPADIAIIGVKPTHEDLASWKRQLEQTMSRMAQLHKFLKSAPEYDLSLLDTNMATIAVSGS